MSVKMAEEKDFGAGNKEENPGLSLFFWVSPLGFFSSLYSHLSAPIPFLLFVVCWLVWVVLFFGFCFWCGCCCFFLA